MPKNEAEFKWTCKQCTYGNWPSATKCVMCKFDPRNSINKNHIAECGNYENNERCHVIDCSSESTCEKHHSGDETSSNSNEKNGGACSSFNKINKWPCTVCSYTNWPRHVFHREPEKAIHKKSCNLPIIVSILPNAYVSITTHYNL